LIDRILYEDQHLIAVEKPAGLLTHHTHLAKGEDSIHAQLSKAVGPVYPLHRLDRATSGVLLFARSRLACSAFGKLFMATDTKHQGVKKVYLALIRGWLEGDGSIDHPLKSLAHTDQRLQSAISHYSLLGRLSLDLPKLGQSESSVRTSRYSLLMVRIETGRRHQIRRHLKHIHHPIIGDSRYGKGDQNRLFRKAFGLNRLFLHSAGIACRHPFTNEKLTIVSNVKTIATEWGGCFEEPCFPQAKKLEGALEKALLFD
jgi:tRNA pseudouridine65 synthase